MHEIVKRVQALEATASKIVNKELVVALTEALPREARKRCGWEASQDSGEPFYFDNTDDYTVIASIPRNKSILLTCSRVNYVTNILSMVPVLPEDIIERISAALDVVENYAKAFMEDSGPKAEDVVKEQAKKIAEQDKLIRGVLLDMRSQVRDETLRDELEEYARNQGTGTGTGKGACDAV